MRRRELNKHSKHAVSPVRAGTTPKIGDVFT
jgi:hypothetical protein